jgi:two-component sensor histidine kinase
MTAILNDLGTRTVIMGVLNVMPLEQEPDTSSTGHRLTTNFVQQLNRTHRFASNAGTLFDLSCPILRARPEKG